VTIGGQAYEIPAKGGILPRDVRDALGLGDTGADYTQEVYDAMSNARFSKTNPIDEFDEIASARIRELQDDIATATGQTYKRETARFLEEEKKRLGVLRGAMVAKDVSPFGSTGRMYEVEVNANPEDFLDWDAPLSAQSKTVQDGINRVGRSVASPLTRVSDSMKGNDLKPLLQDPRAVEELSNYIPGIRYLDAGSRGAGDGSRNYVVFDENLISIVRKYGIAGAAAILGMSQADVASAAGMDAATGQPMAQRPPRQD
jgi:hypothetical protein